jgi:4-hydroxy-tetrahydrodipicolinate synthase
MQWRGVLPAVTTPFDVDGGFDAPAMARHAEWMADSGCKAVVALGSLGEGATLTFAEKQAVLEACVAGATGRIPVVAAVSALSTDEAVRVARMAASAGCQGLMVLPPYAHKGRWEELRAHFGAVFGATGLSCMLYNNPVAYGTDVLPHQMMELAEEHANLAAVKESSGDVRRVTEVVRLARGRLDVSVGVDDLVFEGVAAGAVGWVAGLVNAFPAESVRLFDLLVEGRWDEARRAYHWFLPLLRLDVRPDFVQAIKLVQQEAGRGSERVRLPRLPLEGRCREEALQVIAEARAGHGLTWTV